MKNLGDHYASFDDAMKALVKGFGQPQNTWDAKLNKFVSSCNKPEAWKKLGSKERLSVIAGTCEFLREAEKLAKDHPGLESSIYNVHTVKVLVSVLPPEMTEDVVDSEDDEKRLKQEIQEIKTFMEKKHRKALKLTQYSDELSKAQTNFGAVNAFDSNKETKVQKEEKYHHKCFESNSCKTEWGYFGCVLLYQLPTLQDRREMLIKKKACFNCGKKKKVETHTQDVNKKFWNCKPQIFNRSNPVRCKEQQCRYGAAICLKHSPNNGRQELLDWILKVPDQDQCLHCDCLPS